MGRYATPYRDPRWRRVRARILRRDAGWCQIRGPRCSGTATQVDHIVSWRELPEDQWFAPENLRAAVGHRSGNRSRLGIDLGQNFGGDGARMVE